MVIYLLAYFHICQIEISNKLGIKAVGTVKETNKHTFISKE